MYFRQPRYFTDFRCVGGTCTNSCCIGWNIFWMHDEIDKVKNAPDCSEELKALMESSFHPSSDGVENMFTMTLEEKTNRCPFLTEDNFCRIQRELGAEYLSIVCASYPRGYILTDNECYRYCNMTCPSVMSSLLHDEKSADLVNVRITQNNGVIRGALKGVSEKHPEQIFRGELLELFYEIISDKRYSLETGLVLGALAAQTLTKLVDSGGYGEIPETIKKLRAQLHDAAQLKSIENIKPNYAIKLGVAGSFLSQLSQLNIMSALADRTGKLNIDLYIQGELRLAETYKDKPWYLRNIALNLLLELGVPLKFDDKSIYENYVIFVISFALLKLTAIATAELSVRADAAGYVNRGTDDHLTKAAAFITRSLSHNPKNTDLLLKTMKKAKVFSPAYLALFVK